MRNRGNIVIYAICGTARQPVVSADAASPMAAFTIAGGMLKLQSECAAKGVPFEAKIVHEDVEANAHGQVIFSEYVELNAALAPSGDPQATLEAVFNPSPQVKKGGK